MAMRRIITFTPEQSAKIQKVQKEILEPWLRKTNEERRLAGQPPIDCSDSPAMKKFKAEMAAAAGGKTVATSKPAP